MSIVVPQVSKVYSTFSPTSIPDCAIWLDATDRSTFTFSSGNSVSTWKDKSRNATSFASSNGNPVLTSNLINGVQALDLTNSSGFISSTSIQNSADCSLAVVVVVKNTIATWGNFFHLGGRDFDVALEQNGLDTSYIHFQTGNDNSGVQLAIVYDTPTIYLGTMTSGTSRFFEQINTSGFLTTTGTNSSSINVGLKTCYIGRSDAGEACRSYIGEVIYYNRTITTSEQQQIEGYLARKWGLSSNLTASHPYKNISLFTRPFQPVDISGCTLWLDGADASTVTLVSNAVSQWNDKSGNGRHATQTTAGNRPSYSASEGYLGFSGSSFINLADAFNMLSTAGRRYSFFLVERRGSTYGSTNGTSFPIAGGNTGAVNSALLVGYNTNTVFRHTAAIVTDTDYSVPTWANPDPIRLWGGGYSGTIRDTWLNGTVGTTTSYSTTLGSWDSANLGYLTLFNINSFYIGQIYEVIFYNSYLTSQQRQQVEGYLANKWKLRGNLPSTHPFKLYPSITLIFTPLSITGCQLWLDAADPSGNSSTPSNGATVSTWVDKSGNGRNATTSTSANPPTYNLTSSCLQFRSASSQSLNIAQSFGDALVGVKYSVLIVGRRAANAYVGYLTGESVITNGNLLIAANFTTYVGGYYNGNTASGSMPAYSAPDPVYLMGFDSLSTQLQAVLNGTIVGTGTASDLVSFTGPSIGRRYGGTGFQTYHDMDVFEVLSFVPPLSTNQRQQVEGYLAAKWKLKGSLPATHPFKIITP